jgi:hypothetical protein
MVSSAPPSPIVTSGVVPPTTISPLSLMVVVDVFCRVFPPVPSNLTIALSVEDPGPVTSPTAVLPSNKFNSAAVVVTAAAPNVVNCDCKTDLINLR